MFVLVLAFVIFKTDRKGLSISGKELATLVSRCEDGQGEACWYVAAYYEESDEKFLYWLRKGASNGDPKSQYLLSSILRSKKDNQLQKEARDLLERAASSNLPIAQWELGRLYCEGLDGNKVDLKQAEYWWNRGAKNGNRQAMLDLSKLLIKAYKDEGHFVIAYEWLIIALARSDQKSALADELREQLRTISEKIKKMNYNMSEIQQKANLLSKNDEKNILFESDPIDEEQRFIKKLREGK